MADTPAPRYEPVAITNDILNNWAEAHNAWAACAANKVVLRNWYPKDQK